MGQNDCAWGLRVLCAEVRPDQLVSSDELLPTVSVTVSVDGYVPTPFVLTPDRAEFDLFGDGRVRMDRRSRTSELRMARRPTPDEVIHPLLASTAVIMNHWCGRLTLHAGAVAVEGGAWALLGQRTDGKSSTLGWLAQRGMTVLTDDVLAIEEGKAFSGPRCLDLRSGAAQHLGIGRDLGPSDLRERFRIDLGPAPSHFPLRGLVFLEWADRLALTRLPPRETIPRLFEHLALQEDPPAGQILELAGLPAWRWSRPRRWEEMETSARALLQALGG